MDQAEREAMGLARVVVNAYLTSRVVVATDDDMTGHTFRPGDRVEWNPTGDEWKPGTVRQVGGVGVLILLDENGQTLLAQPEHLRCETVASVRAHRDRLAAELAELHTWRGLMSLLDEHWPADVFDGSSNDPGARIVVLMREIDLLRGALAAVLGTLAAVRDGGRDE